MTYKDRLNISVICSTLSMYVTFHSFSNSTLDGGGRSVSCSGVCYPGKEPGVPPE